MKLLFINNLFGKNAVGGAERVVANEVEVARLAGDDVVVLSARSFFPPNICFYTTMMRLHFPLRLVWHIIDTLNPFSYFWIWFIIHREKPDEIHTHNMKGIGLTAAIAIRHSKIKWIHTVHDVQLITPSGLILFGQERAWEHRNFFTATYRFLCTYYFGSPDEVRFPSEWIKNEYEKYGFFAHSTRMVIRNSMRHCEASFITSCRNPPSIGKKLCNVGVMMYAGQLEPHKGIRELMNAAKQCPEVIFHIYGGGSFENEVREIAKKYSHIFVYGRVGSEELQRAYHNADTLIYPSLCYENAPMSIVEAKAAGLRIIASNIGGIRELLDAQDTLIIPNDIDALVAAIKKHFP